MEIAALLLLFLQAGQNGRVPAVDESCFAHGCSHLKRWAINIWGLGVKRIPDAPQDLSDQGQRLKGSVGRATAEKMLMCVISRTTRAKHLGHMNGSGHPAGRLLGRD